MPCSCLPAADRVVWLDFRLHGLCSSNVACFGVVELKRGACACELVRAGGGGQWGRSISAPRGLALEAGSRGALCVWSSTTSSSAPFSTRWHVFGRSRRACVALRPARCAFFKDFAFRRLKMQNFFWPRRGAWSQGSELALQTRKNRPPAELGEPAERLASCSRSKKSAI